VRLVGSVASPEDAKVATGLAGTGAERLLGQGDFLVVAKGQVTRMQGAYLDVEELRKVVTALQVGWPPELLDVSHDDRRRNGRHGRLARIAKWRPRFGPAK
jgi:DNA segregation ATPase FtsK/SpoIIIE-like protein